MQVALMQGSSAGSFKLASQQLPQLAAARLCACYTVITSSACLHMRGQAYTIPPASCLGGHVQQRLRGCAVDSEADSTCMQCSVSLTCTFGMHCYMAPAYDGDTLALNDMQAQVLWPFLVHAI
jgi:hypothetical protein